GFARDVQRYLADEPALACPPSAWYRLRKFARRHKTGLAVAGLVLFFLVLLGGGIGWAGRDQTARQAALEQEVVRVLAEAEDYCKDGRLPEAKARVERAEWLLAGSAHSEAVRQLVSQWQTDLQMVAKLEEINLKKELTLGGTGD